MDSRTWLLIIVWHMMMIWVCARNMHFESSHGLVHQGQILRSPRTPFAMKEGIGGSRAKEEEVLSRLGSRPPRCEHRCKGCTPCSPIQVPTVHLGPQYANYEPEGWKCKCGSVYYDP
ncbi:putative EPIDERMAL PATTERNING FACTOR-like protein [Helianthus annuus]|nr:putative EPIDERMAL PATTERNING FACTOR-like protein [Helianthus annuus]